MNQESSVPGKAEVRYVAALVALLFMAGTLPSVQAAMQAQAATDPVAETGAALFSFLGFGSSSPERGDRMMKIPEGQGQRLIQMASSSGMKPPEMQRPPGISPQDVVTLLYKNGYISADKIDAARRLVASSTQQRMGAENGGPVHRVEGDWVHASSTEVHASSTGDRNMKMPPRPPMMQMQGDRR